MDEDDNWVKSGMVLNKNFYYKDFLYLVEIGNEKFSKSICLSSKQLFIESRYPLLSSLLSYLC